MNVNNSNPGQSLLVTLSVQLTPVVIHALGDAAQEWIEAWGDKLEDLGFDEDDHPRQGGIYVWEGSLSLTAFGDDCDPEWDGAWRPATAEDLVRFGFALAERGAS